MGTWILRLRSFALAQTGDRDLLAHNMADKNAQLLSVPSLFSRDSGDFYQWFQTKERAHISLPTMREEMKERRNEISKNKIDI